MTQASRLGNASKIGPFFLKYAVPISQKTCRATAGLPEQYRVPLELKMKEYTNREISELLGISMQTLYKRLQRAYAAVRVEMEADTCER